MEGFFCLLTTNAEPQNFHKPKAERIFPYKIHLFLKKHAVCEKKKNALETIMIYCLERLSKAMIFFLKNTGYFSDYKPCTMPISLFQSFVLISELHIAKALFCTLNIISQCTLFTGCPIWIMCCCMTVFKKIYIWRIYMVLAPYQKTRNHLK